MNKKHWLSWLPNALTMLNLWCGAIAAVLIIEDQYPWAFAVWCICLIADFLDGAVAKGLGIASELGKQLDSLADMVSFGVVQGAVYYSIMVKDVETPGIVWWAMPALLIIAAAGMRLGKFNLDTRQSESFIGMATPAATTFAMGVLMMVKFNTWGVADTLQSPYFVYPVVAIFSYLMLSEFPMFSFKIKNLTWKGNEIRFIFIFAALNLLILFKWASFVIIILLYIALSFLDDYLKYKSAISKK